MLKKYIEKYLDKTTDTVVEEGKRTLKQARTALLLIGIGVLIFLTGIVAIIGYIVVKFI